MNTVTVLDTVTGAIEETLSSAMAPGDPPGSTPDSMAVSPDARTLYVANAYNNNVADSTFAFAGLHVRSVSSRRAGFQPPVRATPDAQSPRRERPGPGPEGGQHPFAEYLAPHRDSFHGALAIVGLPKGDQFDLAMAAWTQDALRCPAGTGPEKPGGVARRERADSLQRTGGSIADPLRDLYHQGENRHLRSRSSATLAQGNERPGALPVPRRRRPITPCDRAAVRPPR